MVDGSIEWAAYRDRALEGGVPESALLLEKAARHTAENAAFGAALIVREIGWPQLRRMAVCCKPFHMRRAIMTLHRHIPEGIRLLPQPPAHPGDLSADSWWQSEQGRRRIYEELGKISANALKEDLGDV